MKPLSLPTNGMQALTHVDSPFRETVWSIDTLGAEMLPGSLPSSWPVCGGPTTGEKKACLGR